MKDTLIEEVLKENEKDEKEIEENGKRVEMAYEKFISL